ncbi:trimeric LpxA-like protein [Sphaerosporella brunnea]|uniref:Dynactin subunit 5 n=1 Tax=Sphaerosporella brunnea TaxID=1250544 RepID=A0A5J5ETG3_9PEZI|nr:trimeric LpxA-like protein [Sphaerosporella brunnea]
MPPKQVKGEYIETDTGNKVSRKSNILGSQNIILGGKTIIQADCTIRGDLRRAGAPGQHGNVAIAVGRYCFFARSSVLKPPGKTHRGAFSFYPMKLGDHVFIGEGAVVEAAMVGNFVHIGAGAVIGKFAIIKDCVRIEEGTVVAPHTVIPPFSRVAGRPGVVVEELPETAQESLELKQLYRVI